MTVTLDRVPPAAAPPHQGASAFARIDVFEDPAQALGAWRELAPETCGSLYQGEAFALRWLETCGRKLHVSPFFIVARDAAGAPLALLPLGVRRFGPLRVAEFLGGKHSNYNLGLFRPGCDFSVQDLRSLLRQASRQGNGGPHLYRLLNLPRSWDGAANPLCLLPNQPAPDNAYSTKLCEDGDAFLAGRLSSDTRKKLRKKEKRLAGMGALRYLRAENQIQATQILGAFFAQKERRLPGLTAEAETNGVRAFYSALASIPENGAPPTLELHALTLDDRIVAVLAAGLNGGRLQGNFNSFDDDPEIAKSSPGDILLTHVLRDACARKIAAFDLGVGDARYKATFCNEVEPMADAFFAPGFVGLAAKPVFAAAMRLKTAIKRDARLKALIGRLRGGAGKKP